MSTICKQSFSAGNFDLCHAQLRSAAVERYEKHGLIQSILLFVRKLYHQAGQQNYFYNAQQSIVGYTTSKTAQFMSNYMIFYTLGLFFLSAQFMYGMAKQVAARAVFMPLALFGVLLLIGWFFLFILTESAPRYASILYPLFILFSALLLDEKFKRTVAASAERA
jgi:hypothetical protein